MNLNSSPFWILIPLLLGLGYAYWFYSRGPKFGKRLSLFLSALRGILIFLITFLFLDPSFKWKKEEEEKPVILFLQDDSESAKTGWKNDSLIHTYTAQVQELIKHLKKKFTVDTYSFGEESREGLQFTYTGRQTDFSPMLEILRDRYAGRNLGAVILASDGLFNKGEGPDPGLSKLHIPIFSIGMGDTSVQRDLILNQVDYNEVVFSGDKFPIRVSVSAHNLGGEKGILTLRQGGKLIQKLDIDPHGTDDQIWLNFKTDLVNPGNYLFELEASGFRGEKNLRNNVKKFFITALKSRQDILILSYIDHPDISALKQALGLSNHNEVHFHFPTDKNLGNISSYSCVILYQIPTLNGDRLSGTLEKELNGLPVLRILGVQTGAPEPYQQTGNSPFLSRISTFGNKVDRINKDFRLFSLDDSLVEMVPKFPPLEGMFQLGGFNPEYVLASSSLVTNPNLAPSPLILLEDKGNKKNAWIMGEGIWKWRTYEFARTGNHHLVDDFLQKIISYLTVLEDKSRFRLIQTKKIWNENETIQVQAEVYNKNFELITNTPVQFDLVNQDKKVFHYSFSPEGVHYELNLGNLPVGNYNYIAKAPEMKGNDFIKTGNFLVEPSSLEFADTRADHSILKRLSRESGGFFYTENHMPGLENSLMGNESIKPVIHERKGYLAWIEWPIILGLLLVLLSLEWALRKWNGFY